MMMKTYGWNKDKDQINYAKNGGPVTTSHLP